MAKQLAKRVCSSFSVFETRAVTPLYKYPFIFIMTYSIYVQIRTHRKISHLHGMYSIYYLINYYDTYIYGYVCIKLSGH